MKLIYRPIGIVLGLLGGQLAKRIATRVWEAFDDEEAPKPTIEQTSWAKVLTAAAVQGLVMQVVRATINRSGAQGFAWLTGVWPGKQRTEPR